MGLHVCWNRTRPAPRLCCTSVIQRPSMRSCPSPRSQPVNTRWWCWLRCFVHTRSTGRFATMTAFKCCAQRNTDAKSKQGILFSSKSDSYSHHGPCGFCNVENRHGIAEFHDKTRIKCKAWNITDISEMWMQCIKIRVFSTSKSVCFLSTIVKKRRALPICESSLSQTHLGPGVYELHMEPVLHKICLKT